MASRFEKFSEDETCKYSFELIELVINKAPEASNSV